jgi:hypothetical protein
MAAQDLKPMPFTAGVMPDHPGIGVQTAHLLERLSLPTWLELAQQSRSAPVPVHAPHPTHTASRPLTFTHPALHHRPVAGATAGALLHLSPSQPPASHQQRPLPLMVPPASVGNPEEIDLAEDSSSSSDGE